MLMQERLIIIERELQAKKVLKLKDIAIQLGVSESTVRRDFDVLEEQGKLVRVFGGVMKPKAGSTLTETSEVTMGEKLDIHYDAKKRICMEAAKLVKDGDCIFIDGGTSLDYLFEKLCNKNIKIVTHSNLFIRHSSQLVAEIIVIGGKYNPKYNMNVGPIAMEILKQFNFDIAFIGCAGINIEEKIATTADLETATIKKLAMENSISSYLLVDESKIGVNGFYRLKPLEEFDAVFMDAYPDKTELLDNIIICG